MTIELLEALLAILKACLEQDTCKNCPLNKFCEKMPCEW